MSDISHAEFEGFRPPGAMSLAAAIALAFAAAEEAHASLEGGWKAHSHWVHFGGSAE